MGKDFFGQQLIGVEASLALGPVIGHQHIAAKATGLFGQPFELSDRIIRRADDRRSGLNQRVGPFARVRLLRGEGQGHHVLEVIDPVINAVLDLFEGLFAGGRDMHRPDQAPGGPINRVTVFLGLVVPDLPVVAQNGKAAHAGRAQ